MIKNLSRTVLLVLLGIMLAACTREVPQKSYYKNPYEGQPGAPERLTGDQFRKRVREDNPTPFPTASDRYEDAAARSTLNTFDTLLRRAAQ